MADDVMLTEKELATRWKVTTRTLQNWRKDGNGKGPAFVDIGEKQPMIRYRMSAVLAHENRKQQGEGNAE